MHGFCTITEALPLLKITAMVVCMFSGNLGRLQVLQAIRHLCLCDEVAHLPAQQVSPPRFKPCGCKILDPPITF